MDIAGAASLIAAIAGSAGVTALLALMSRLSDIRRAQRLVGSIEETLKVVAEDQVAKSVLELNLRVAAVQLAATNLVRVPLHRLLKPSGQLALIAFALVAGGVLIVAVLGQLFGDGSAVSPILPWALAGSVASGFFLAYRSALSEHRCRFVADVLQLEKVDLHLIRKYNKSFENQ